MATSAFLKPTRDLALRTTGLHYADQTDQDPAREMVGRETRKMNLYQAVRDALRHVLIFELVPDDGSSYTTALP